jgi:hypothetical protein
MIHEQNHQLDNSSGSLTRYQQNVPDMSGTHETPYYGTQETPSYGTMPRPTATVKPLPTPMEQDLTHTDLHIPFANERSGTIKLKTSPTEAFARLQAEEKDAIRKEETTKEDLEPRQNNLLKTPTRAGNRTAGDVMDDISTMLADLTDELDSMLCADSVHEG